MTLFLLGIVGGIALSLFFSFGPAFFSQIQASIHYGFRNAVPFAFGVNTGDLLIVAFLLLISRKMPIEDMANILNNRWIIYCGAAVVCSFGLYTMFLKTRHTTEAHESERLSFHRMKAPSHMNVYFRGLTLNFLNPLIWIYWVTLVTIFFYGDNDVSIAGRYLFFGGVLIATLSMDILKCKLASLLQRVITLKFLNIFNKCVGAILIGFAIFMFISTTTFSKKNENNQKPAQMIEQLMHTHSQIDQRIKSGDSLRMKQNRLSKKDSNRKGKESLPND